ncbi:unnamed protein product [Lathyrus oleraceus]
MNLGSGRVQI